MGGAGSGRKPDPNNVLKRNYEMIRTGNQEVYIPNNSFVKKEVLKTDSSTIITSTKVYSFALKGGTGGQDFAATDQIILGNPNSEATTPVVIKGGKSGYYLLELNRSVGATQRYGIALTSGSYTWVDLTASGTPYVFMNGYTSSTAAPYGEARAFLAIGKTGVSDSNAGIASQLKGSDSGLSRTNGLGGNLYIEAGRGTGNATPAKIHFLTSTAVASGTTQQTNSIRMSLVGDSLGIGNVAPSEKLDVTGSINASVGFKVNTVAGGSGSFTSADGKTVTVVGGIITTIV